MVSFRAEIKSLQKNDCCAGYLLGLDNFSTQVTIFYGTVILIENKAK